MIGGTDRRPKDRAEKTAVPASSSPEWTADEPRWMRDQRTRRRRLTQRGRATLLSATFFAVVVLGWVIDPFSPVRAASQRGNETETPPVSAAAPPVAEVSPDAALGIEPDVQAVPEVPSFVLERVPITRAALSLPITGEAADAPPARSPGHLFERIPAPSAQDRAFTVEYTLDAQLTHQVFEVLEHGRVGLGNVVVMDPSQGRVLAYASTDPERFPPTRSYPAASLVKVITAATVLDLAPEAARMPCRFRGSPYRLNPSRIDPPRRGREVTLERALATSNNQCFAQLAVHAVGVAPLIAALGRFGWLSVPAPAHASGEADPGEGRYDTGRLGCGLAGCRITPLHAAQLAATLAHGDLVSPRWIERVWDPDGRELALPSSAPGHPVLSAALTEELRAMLVETTRSGTARRAFRKRNGQPLLGSVAVAGKTGSLSGKNPDGRYEWFIGVAPAASPRIAIATVVVGAPRFYRTASQVAAEVLESLFCERGRCDASRADRFAVPQPTETVARVIPLHGAALPGTPKRISDSP
jgi:peptidoglycan glycosyltransferase